MKNSYGRRCTYPRKSDPVPLGLSWRWSLYNEYLFYLVNCKNYKCLIRARQDGTDISKIVLRNGVTIRTSGSARFVLAIFREIWQNRIYVKDLKGPSPGVVVDIGAHVGMFSLLAATLWPHACIHAYEPEPMNHALLIKNIDSPPLSNVIAYNQAVCGHSGTVDLYLKEQTESHSTYNTPYGGKTKDILCVNSTTLVEVIERIDGGVIDFLKVDCEGCEYDLIRNGIDEFRSHVRYVVMEYHEGKTGYDPQEAIVKPLEQEGFTVDIKKHPRGDFGFIVGVNDIPVCGS